MFASRPGSMGQVLGIVYRVIATHLIKKGPGSPARRARTSAVTLIQRFGSVLNLNLHSRMLFLDGDYVVGAHGTVERFRLRHRDACGTDDSLPNEPRRARAGELPPVLSPPLYSLRCGWIAHPYDDFSKVAVKVRLCPRLTRDGGNQDRCLASLGHRRRAQPIVAFLLTPTSIAVPVSAFPIGHRRIS